MTRDDHPQYDRVGVSCNGGGGSPYSRYHTCQFLGARVRVSDVHVSEITPEAAGKDFRFGRGSADPLTSPSMRMAPPCVWGIRLVRFAKHQPLRVEPQGHPQCPTHTLDSLVYDSGDRMGP